MRISDWSSDVCSSDLHPASCIWSWRCPRPCMSGSCRREPARATVSLSVEHRLDIASDHPGWRCTEQPHMPKYYPTLDRKSVVEGKSVSVRVDHGGRRSSKKKNRK